MSSLEIIGFVFGVICVWLNTKENIWGWPTGLLSVGVYVFIFYDAKYYADMGLQAVFFVSGIYGWYQWSVHRGNLNKLAISSLSVRWVLPCFLAVLFFAVTLGYILDNYTDGALPYFDASTTAVSLLAQFMLARKIIQNWLLWIAVDVVYIGMYLYKDLYLTALLYLIYFGLAIYGYYLWKKTLQVA